uniref:Uncharacterized protein n=1 Tax=Anguilla anguilla TaxID=7936 RepID=A0A0E9U6A9_ANGAN
MVRIRTKSKPLCMCCTLAYLAVRSHLCNWECARKRFRTRPKIFGCLPVLYLNTGLQERADAALSA